MDFKKAFIVVAAGAMLVSGIAFAQTDKDALIAQLLQQIQALQAQLTALAGGSMPTAGAPTGLPAGFQFATPMREGYSGIDAKYLQMILNQDPATQVSLTGAGSPGLETAYFGAKTTAAVKKFQEKNGVIFPGTGYVGNLTIAKLNEMLIAVPSIPTEPSEPTTPSDTGTVEGTGSGVEGSLTASLWSSPADETTVKGGEEAKIVGYKVKVSGSDIRMKRFHVDFSNKIWAHVNSVILYDGDTKVAEATGLSSSDFEEVSTTQYRLTFSGLDYNLAKASTHYFYIAIKTNAVVTAQTTWDITLPANAIRGVDGKELNQYAPSSALTAREFNLSTAQTADIEVSIGGGQVDKIWTISSVDTTYDVELGKVNMKGKYIHSQITQIDFYIYAKGGMTQWAAKDVDAVTTVAKLYDGDTILGSATVADDGSTNSDSSSGDGQATARFADLTLTLDKDQTKTLTIKVEVPKIQGGATNPNVGDYLYFAWVDGGIVGTDDNVNTITDSGSATSKYTYIYEKYPVIALTSATMTKSTQSGGTAAASSTDTGTGSVVFTIKAIGGDVYFDSAIGNASATSARGITVTSSVQSIANNKLTMDTIQTTAETDSTAGYVVRTGDTKTFTVSGSVVPQDYTGRFYYLLTDYFTWSTTSVATPVNWWASSTFRILEDWKTNSVWLKNN